MGKSEFYIYNGGVQTLPCSVKDYVFSDFNSSQAEKCFAAVNSSFLRCGGSTRHLVLITMIATLYITIYKTFGTMAQWYELRGLIEVWKKIQ